MSKNKYLLIALVALSYVGNVSSARAHLGSTKYLEVTATDTEVRVAVYLDVLDARALVGLPPEGGAGAVMTHRGVLGGVLARGIRVEASTRCPLALTELHVEARHARTFVRATLAARCDVSSGITLTDATVFDQDPQHDAIVRYRGREVAILRRGRQSVRITDGDALATFSRFVGTGMVHFATGADHVLFLVALLLPFGRVAVREGRRRALREVLVVVTAFTVGHSVTLALAAEDVITLPSKPTEALIALSVVVVALLRFFRPTANVAIPWLALAFGLVHGLGFSSVLTGSGARQEGHVLALFGFNVGLELAQAALVVALLPLLARAAEEASYVRVVVRGGSASIAALGFVWMLERLA
jgi:hypothetical protein